MKLRSILSIAALGCALTPIIAQPTVDFVLNSGLSEPHSIAVDEDNRFYLTDSARQQVFQYDPANGQLTILAGTNGKPGSDNGPGFIATFLSPKGVVAARGGVVVADSGNHVLRFLDLSRSVAVVSTLAGAMGTAGSANGAAVDARFNSPIGLAAAANGDIYIADSKNNAIRVLRAGSDLVETVATEGLSEPSAIALDSANNRLFVADTRNHAIKVIDLDTQAVTLLAGSGARIAGSTDNVFADEAQFNSPTGLLWVGGSIGLLVSDTGNHTLRRVYFDPVVFEFFPERGGYSVETYAGTAGIQGFEDGLLTEALFRAPSGMARDQDAGFLVADVGNKALRRIQTTPRLPQVPNPSIGYVEFIIDELTGASVSRLAPVTDQIFNNDVIIAIRADTTAETFYTVGATPGLGSTNSIPNPTPGNRKSAPAYRDGLPPNQVPLSMENSSPDMTFKAVSTADGRRPSEVVQARFRFKVAPPLVTGDNAASFRLLNSTEGAQMFYTLDGSTPSNDGTSIGPVASNEILSFRFPDGEELVTFKAIAYKNNYQPSEIITTLFDANDFQAHRITFGFERGEASSEFFASPGQRFYAPVTLSLLPDPVIYSLQFNASVNALGEAENVDPATIGFQSMLKMFNPLTTLYETIQTNYSTLNTNINLLGVGWIERDVIGSELYNTQLQDLITSSIAHDTLFQSSGGKVVTGAFHFRVPPNAVIGQDEYLIQLDRPSATSDGIGTPGSDVFIDLPKRGSIGGGLSIQ